MSNYIRQMCSIIVFLNKIYNTYRDLHMRIILNNVLKLLLIMQSIVENVFCQQFYGMLLSHVTVADQDGNDSSRLYPNERYRSERYGSI